MDQQSVRKLEDEVEKSITQVIMNLGRKRLPVLPSQRTMHLMAKAAVAVYEAVAENDISLSEDHDEQRTQP